MLRDSYTKISGSLIASGGIIFLIFNTISEAIFPGYNVGLNALSDLGAIGEPTRFLWDGQLLVGGVLSFLGVYFLFFKSSWEERKIGKRKLVGALYLLPSVGTIIVALFPENLIPSVHLLGAIITFTLGGITAIYAFRLTTPPFRYFCIVLGIMSLASTPLLGAGALLGFGLVERMVVYPFVIWAITFGSYLLALSSSPRNFERAE